MHRFQQVSKRWEMYGLYQKCSAFSGTHIWCCLQVAQPPPQPPHREFYLHWLQAFRAAKSNGNTRARNLGGIYPIWIQQRGSTLIDFHHCNDTGRKPQLLAHPYPKTSMPFSSYCPKTAPGIPLLPLPHQVALVSRGAGVQWLKSVCVLGCVIVTWEPNLIQPTRKRIHK